MCIVHAITRDGPLATFGVDGRPVAGHEFVASGRGKKLQRRKMGEGEHTAEYLFEGKSKGDYHDSMNNRNFEEWVELQLVPTFEAKYRDKKMILVLDNAPYHHNIELPPLTSMNKGKLKKLLQDHGECPPKPT